jgi:hypothetical protein
MKQALLDALTEGSDLTSQGANAAAHARQFLSDLAHELSKLGPDMVRIGLPLARRLVGDSMWPHKLHMQEFIQFCHSKLDAYPQGAEADQPGLDVQAMYLESCATEYMQKW